jgi:hypothetical protein
MRCYISGLWARCLYLYENGTVRLELLEDGPAVLGPDGEPWSEALVAGDQLLVRRAWVQVEPSIQSQHVSPSTMVARSPQEVAFAWKT